MLVQVSPTTHPLRWPPCPNPEVSVPKSPWSATPTDSCVFTHRNVPSGEFDTSPSQAEIPDVRGMLAKNPRYSKLNFEINKAYVKMAEQFQDIYDPERALSPSWYGFAPYASRQAGGSIKMAERLTGFMEGYGSKPKHAPEVEAELTREFPDHEEREMASYSLSLLGPAATPDGPSPSMLGDIKHLTIAAKRLASMVRKDSGPLGERLTRIARTTRNMLEAGNRAIVSEIGVAGQDYLHFRRPNVPTPEDVLQNFTVEGTPKNPTQARQVYAKMESIVRSGAMLVTEWDADFPKEEFDRSNFLVAAFAAYEAARLESDPDVKNRWIEQAGIVMAFREQKDTVQPAFDGLDGKDEVSRKELMTLVTPWVEVPTRDGTWTFRKYSSDHLPPGDDNPWTPRAAEYSWGDFNTRWGGILDFFNGVFDNPESIWPMPSPEPSDPLGG
jgi:hypothetical protein